MGVFCKKVAFFYIKIVLFAINGVYLYQQRKQYLNKHKKTIPMDEQCWVCGGPCMTHGTACSAQCERQVEEWDNETHEDSEEN